MCVWGGGGWVFSPVKQCSGHKLSVLTIQINSDTIYVIPQVKGSFEQDFFPLSHACFQSSFTSPGCYLCFWSTGYKWEVPTTPTLGSINLLKWLTELGETLYLLDHQFIIREYNSGMARWKSCVGQGMGKECGVAMPAPGCHSPSTPTRPPTRKLCEPSPFGFLWRFHYIGMIG